MIVNNTDGKQHEEDAESCEHTARCPTFAGRCPLLRIYPSVTAGAPGGSEHTSGRMTIPLPDNFHQTPTTFSNNHCFTGQHILLLLQKNKSKGEKKNTYFKYSLLPIP